MCALTNMSSRAIFFFNMLLGIWSCIPSASDRAARKLGTDDMQMDESPVAENDKEWGARSKPLFTPRTLAFNTLDRQLPLRSQDGR